MEETQQNDQKMEFRALCEEFRANNQIPPEKFDLYQVKRGLRNPDGTGVMAGLTLICNVHGYLIDDAERIPDKGILTYRGINVEDIVEGCRRENRFGFEEVAWLLLFGKQPTRSQLEGFSKLLNSCRELPEYFAEDMIIKAPSRNIMNKLGRSVLALYSYDDNPDDPSLENNMRQAIQLIARLPTIMTYAYQVKRRHFDRQSMFFHPLDPNHSTAEAILNAIRPDRVFTDEEAKLLDLCMILHAEHGGRQQLHLYHARAFLHGDGYLFRNFRRHRFLEGAAPRWGEPPRHDDDGRFDGACEKLGERRRSGKLLGKDCPQGGRRPLRADLWHGPCGLYAVRPGAP